MRRTRYAGLGAALAVVLTGAACGDEKAAPREAPRPAVVFAIGDSYTTGIHGLPADRAYAAETARLLGWQIIIGGNPGSGYAAGGAKAFGPLFQAQFAWRPAPDLVLLAGGHNDVVLPGPAVAAKAKELVAIVRQRYPRAKIVMLGPMWGRDPGPKALAVRDVIAAAAAEVKVPFVDPLAGRWITGNVKQRTGNAVQYIRADGIHPNYAGNRYVAGRLATELRTLGLDRPHVTRSPAPR
ncbi:SGNH/GDSL hydrolase family protein [Actinomadura flavalba]|uniref:SGNH/GDSL hydrolase family protein n=1 Tax=Actinomadura flavalba TaxID=1120938 RepID=UPI00037C2EEB|nr:SGNH/GDSL hydrolase family protein [Actinomadura flavalba]